MTKAPDFEEVLGEQLQVIDEFLALAGMPISDRPLTASLEFVDKCIIDAKGISLEKPLTQPWFAHLHAFVKRWYMRRYGERNLRGVVRNGLGAVMIFGTPFLVEVPLTLLEAVEPGDRSWLCFPTTIHQGERPLTWVVNPPDFSRMPPHEAEAIEAKVSEVAVMTRLIAVDLLTAERPTDKVGAMLEGIRSHLDAAVGHLCSPQGAARALAIWDLHLAVEKAFKAFLLERTSKANRTHDLVVLHSAACAAGMVPLPPDILPSMPSGREAVRHRYGEDGQPCVRYTFGRYENALQAVAHIVAAHSRRFIFRDSSFLIQVPPWDKPGSA
jgi:hypothetical protein